MLASFRQSIALVLGDEATEQVVSRGYMQGAAGTHVGDCRRLCEYLCPGQMHLNAWQRRWSTAHGLKAWAAALQVCQGDPGCPPAEQSSHSRLPQQLPSSATGLGQLGQDWLDPRRKLHAYWDLGKGDIVGRHSSSDLTACTRRHISASPSADVTLAKSRARFSKSVKSMILSLAMRS